MLDEMRVGRIVAVVKCVSEAVSRKIRGANVKIARQGVDVALSNCPPKGRRRDQQQWIAAPS